MDVLIFEAVTSPHNFSGLWHLYNLVEAHVKELRSLGVSPESNGGLLLIVNEQATSRTLSGNW